MNERRTGPEMGNPGATNKGRGTPAMKPKPPSTVDPIEREIERALQPGAFIRDGQCASFVSGLEEIATTVDKLITTDPARAVELYETFLAGCHAKADELDDSSGSFGQFARDVIYGWIKARQSSGANPDMTASTLLGWMDDDPYAFCYEIEKDVRRLGIRSIAVPPLGCGLGGLNWRDVRPMIENSFSELPDVRVLLFPPVV